MSTTTASVPQAADAAPGPGGGHANFARLVLAEWTKLRTVRSTMWSFTALIVGSVGLTGLITWLTEANWNSGGPKQAANHASLIADPLPTILGAGLGLGQLAICVLGCMVATTEYSTGMIRSTLLASPHRLRMLSAKAIAFTIPTLIIGELVGFASFFVGSAILHKYAPISLSDHNVLRSVIGVGLYLAMLGLFSLAIGQLLRHTAGSITGTIALVLVLEPLAALLPGNWGAHIHAYLPTVAGPLLGDPSGQQSGVAAQLLSAWQGYGVFALWTALLLGVASWLLVKRDA